MKSVKNFIQAYPEHAFRITFAAVFIFRSIMQLFPWLVIHGINEDYVAHGAARDMVYCTLGLGILLIRWKMTFIRIVIPLASATLVTILIFMFAVIVREHEMYFTLPYWIFSFLTFGAWSLGIGLLFSKPRGQLAEYLLSKLNIIKTKSSKSEKNIKKRKMRKKR